MRTQSPTPHGPGQFALAALALSFLLIAAPLGAGVNEKSYEILENGAGKFKIDIPGAPTASANVESITVEDLVIDERDLGDGADGWRVYGPGDAHYGSITIRARVGKDSKELYQWWLAAASGKDTRKSITVTSLKRDQSDARTWVFRDAVPTRWDAGEYSPSSRVACETIVCKIGRVELATAAPRDVSDTDCDGTPDPPPAAARLRGIRDLAGEGGVARVELTFDHGKGTPAATTCRLTTITGGAAGIEARAATPGHKYVDTLVLHGPLTSSRSALTEIVSEALSGKPAPFNVTVHEVLEDGTDGKTYQYTDCFLTRYVFPAFSASGTGNLYEEVTIKPIRLELSP